MDYRKHTKKIKKGKIKSQKKIEGGGKNANANANNHHMNIIPQIVV